MLLGQQGPISLTLACDPFAIERPSELAERLPKVLIHQNVTGQRIHDLLNAADRAWASAAGHGVFGPRVRWRAMLELLAADRVPVEPPRRRMRDGVLSVPWASGVRAIAERFGIVVVAGMFCPSDDGRVTNTPVSYTHLTLPTTPYV